MNPNDTKTVNGGGSSTVGSTDGDRSTGEREAAPTSNNSTTKLADIEKRKSFADMKLAEVATGGQQWNFEDLPEEPSTPPPPCDEAEATEANDEEALEDNYKNGTDHNDDPETDHGLDMHCNGHEAAETEDKNGQEIEEDDLDL